VGLMQAGLVAGGEEGGGQLIEHSRILILCVAWCDCFR
jgi:hypothetical protein